MNGFPERPPRDRSTAEIVRRAVDSNVEVGRHQILAARQWSDDYPDVVDVSVQVDTDTGLAYVVISSQAVWLSIRQVDEIVDWLGHCQHIVTRHNAATTVDEPAVDGRKGRDV